MYRARRCDPTLTPTLDTRDCNELLRGGEVERGRGVPTVPSQSHDGTDRYGIKGPADWETANGFDTRPLWVMEGGRARGLQASRAAGP